MATDFVIDGDAGHDPDALPPVSVRIDGEVYEAHCPKDSVGLLIADLETRADDPSEQREIIEQMLLMVLSPEDAGKVMDKVLDLGNRRVGVGYVVDLVQKIAKHYESDLKARRAEMGLEPANREERRAAKKAPAKRTATKKAAAAVRRS